MVNGYAYIGTKDVNFDNSINYDNGIKIPFEAQKFKIAHRNSTLLCIEGGSAGRKIGYLEQDVCFGNKLATITSFIVNSKYIFYLLQSTLLFNFFKINITGIIGGVSINKLKTLIIPLPPLKEQQRIIEKYENILPYIRRYYDIYERLEKINNKNKKELKKSILQYTIQGKLVKQDPNDEPADVLINKILSEKRKLIKSKKIKKENLSVIYKDSTDNQFYEKFDDGTIKNITDEIPFEIPDNWAWTKIKNLSKIITKGSSPSWQGVKYIEKSRNSILFITSENVGKNKIVKDNMKYLEKKFNKIQPRSILEKNDILTNIVGASIGRSCIYDLEYEDTNINQAVCLIRLINKELNNYVLSFLNSPFCYKNLLINSVETARPNISLNTIGNLLIPLPPINEQKEIVLKLNNIIDKLETAE